MADAREAGMNTMAPLAVDPLVTLAKALTAPKLREILDRAEDAIAKSQNRKPVYPKKYPLKEPRADEPPDADCLVRRVVLMWQEEQEPLVKAVDDIILAKTPRAMEKLVYIFEGKLEVAKVDEKTIVESVAKVDEDVKTAQSNLKYVDDFLGQNLLHVDGDTYKAATDRHSQCTITLIALKETLGSMKTYEATSGESIKNIITNLALFRSDVSGSTYAREIVNSSSEVAQSCRKCVGLVVHCKELVRSTDMHRDYIEAVVLNH
jgi:hypothetical protein